MKYMKLGSKLDAFQTDGKNIRYVANDLATDIVVNIAEVKFYLHKFPLLSKSARLQKLVATATEENSEEININDIPGGPTAFEICMKFCYGMTVTLNAYNVVAVRCAAEYLGMHETVEKGNLVYKIEVFLNSSLLRTWKDSVIVLQSTRSLLPFSEELKIVSRCIDSIASKASADTAKVDWSYTYNQKNLPDDSGNAYNGVVSRPTVPQDWWVEDICDLETNLYKQVISAISSKRLVPNGVIGQALKAYAYRRLPGLTKTVTQGGDLMKSQLIVDMIVWLLPAERGTVSCSFLLKLLKAAVLVDSEELTKRELIRRIGWQLEEASVNDLLIRAPEGEATIYDVDIVQKLVHEFLMQDESAGDDSPVDHMLKGTTRQPGILSDDASKLMVAKLIDGYLAEIAKHSHLPLSTFICLAEMVSAVARPAHDGLYRAIDTYLKEHPGISKSERKKVCRLMDCKKLSADASMHAVQNERLPLRVVVQVLFFEQARAAASSGSSTPDLPKGIKDLNGSSNDSSKSAATTNTEEDWDAVATTEELKALKGEMASLRLNKGSKRSEKSGDRDVDKAAVSKMKGLLMSKKIFSRIWSGKGAQCENSGSDSSDSLGSANQEEVKSTPSRNRRHSVS